MATALGLGLAALGRPGYINLGHARDLDADYDVKAMEAHCHRVLDAAYRAGVRWFDTARSYGRGEEFLAHWLEARAIPIDAVTVSSKWGYTYVAEWRVQAAHHEIKDHSPEALDRQIIESRALLGPRLGLYQVHSATLESGILTDDRVLGRLAELRDGGLPIGLTLSGPKQRETLEHALAIRVGGRPLWSSVQATWNLLERGVTPALQSAKDSGLRVIVKEALANGRLTDAHAPPRLREEASRLGASVDAVALSCALAQPFVDIVLSGAATEAQIVSNARATALDGASVFARLGSLLETPERYWAERASLPWN